MGTTGKGAAPKTAAPPTQLPETLTARLAPLMEQAKTLELPILRQQESLLRLEAQRDKILAFKQGMLEAFYLSNDLDPTRTSLAPDGKTLIIK